MRLFIQIRDGQPHEHPIMDWNFRDAFPDIDINNLPPQFANFERIECDIALDVYEAAECFYEWDATGSYVRDVWKPRPMTEEERVQKDLFLIEMVKVKAEESLRSLDNSGSTPNVII
jgi:hypothetical protein